MSKEKKPRGFALLTPERRREIAAMGGRAVPAEKRKFSTDPEFAARVGRKGGETPHPETRSFTRDPELASRAARSRRKDDAS